MLRPDSKILDTVMDGWLVEGGHHYPLVVQFEDTDAGGIVYHSNYINYAERGRTGLLRVCNVFLPEMIKRDEVIVVRRLQIDYKRPSFMGERLIVMSDQFILGKASFTMRQTIADEESTVRAVLSVEGAFVSVSTGKPIRVPADIRTKMQAIPSAPVEAR